STRVNLSQIIEAGDSTDRAVAKAGVTTVNLASRSNPSKGGSPQMAYKPAADSVSRAVVANPSALHLVWDDKIREQVGADVRTALKKAAEYKKKWEDYEKAQAEWSPPAPKANDKDEEEEEDEKEEDDEDKKEDKKDDKKKSKKKKGEDDVTARPVSGVWEGKFTVKDSESSSSIRLRLSDVDSSIVGNLRCDDLSSSLVSITGARDEKHVSLAGFGSGGTITIALDLNKDGLAGKVTVAGVESELTIKQTSTEYVVAKRSERRPTESVKPVKGTPKSPGLTPDLEPLRQAMMGKGCVMVTVTRSDDVLACVAAFEAHGIKPVLYGASGSLGVLSKIKGRVAGILLTGAPTGPAGGTKVFNRYAAVSDAGIPIAFQSQSEEGAVELQNVAAYAVAHGMSPQRALTALTAGAADILGISDRVGRLHAGKDADVLLLDGDPLDLSSRIQATWVAGKEIR
ncbi:MAG: hypothetical protein ACI9S9_004825, partial [Planctomycetota bacterium]